MRWVDGKSYVGVDRRKQRPKLRFGERRLEAGAMEAPPLGAALRQLRIRAAVANTPSNVRKFVERTKVIADLAAAYGEPDLRDALMRLAAIVAVRADEDWRDQLNSALEKLSTRFDTVRANSP